MELAKEVAQEDRTLVPPVPEQLRVVGGQHEGGLPDAPGRAPRLLFAAADEVRRVRSNALERRLGIVRLAVRKSPVGDPVVLEPEVGPGPPRRKKLSDFIQRQIESLVAVVLAVVRVARITLRRRPDLPR